MYTDNNARFPIGDSGDELELIELLTRTCKNCRNGCQMQEKNNANCDSLSCELPAFNNNTPLAMVYCPDHSFDNMYDECTALERGTMFKGLDKPFCGMSINGGLLK